MNQYMSKIMIKVLVIFLTVTAFFIYCHVVLAEPLKIAAVYPNAPESAPFSKALHEGLAKAAKENGYVYDFAENVKFADVARFIRGYAERGYTIIFAHTTGFKSAVNKIAPSYPDVLFGLFWSKPDSPNGFAYNWMQNEGGYLLGVVAGMMTKNNDIGYVGGMKVPNQIMTLGGFEAGVKSVNPEAEVYPAFSGSFSDAAADKEIAVSHINRGSDFIMDVTAYAWLAVQDLAREKGVRMVHQFAFHLDDVVLAGQVLYYDRLLKIVLEDAKKGQLKKEYWGTLDNGICDVQLSEEGDIPVKVREAVDEARRKIISGEIEVPRLDLEMGKKKK